MWDEGVVGGGGAGIAGGRPVSRGANSPGSGAGWVTRGGGGSSRFVCGAAGEVEGAVGGARACLGRRWWSCPPEGVGGDAGEVADLGALAQPHHGRLGGWGAVALGVVRGAHDLPDGVLE